MSVKAFNVKYLCNFHLKILLFIDVHSMYKLLYTLIRPCKTSMNSILVGATSYCIHSKICLVGIFASKEIALMMSKSKTFPAYQVTRVSYYFFIVFYQHSFGPKCSSISYFTSFDGKLQNDNLDSHTTI